MMRAITASPTTALHHIDAGLATTVSSDHPQYRHVGAGRFLPANDAAREECRRWNQYADMVNARTARSSTP